MGTFLEAALALVCAAGLAFVLWWLVGLALRPVPGGQARVVVPGRGDGGELEQLVRSFLWLRGMGLLRSTLVIADIDLTPAGRELAFRLIARWPEVVLWPADRLGEYLE